MTVLYSLGYYFSFFFFFFKQKTAYEMRISDWSSDVCSSDLEQIVIQPRIYEASLSTLMRLLRGFDNDDFHIMLFGHNPGLRELACSLAHCPFDDLQTCAVVQLAFAAKECQALDTDSGELLSYLFPKQQIGRASCRERVCQYVSISVCAV